MMLMSRLKWLAIPLALGIGAASGVVVNQQLMIRAQAAKEKAELARAEVPPVPVPESPMPEPATPGAVPSPFDMDGAPAPEVEKPAEIKVEPPFFVKDGQVLFDPPPGYFDLPAPNKNDGTDPPIIKPGQVLQVEVLETLPGRPITGDHLVRPDGTISLGFYGDLRVAGLNRYQIKSKLLEHLRKFINDEPLGLLYSDAYTNQPGLIPPVQSSRVFIDESANYYPVSTNSSARPAVKEGAAESPASNARIAELEQKLDRVLKELEALRGVPRPAEPGPAAPANPTEKPPG